jgi:hypothetical protein
MATKKKVFIKYFLQLVVTPDVTFEAAPEVGEMEDEERIDDEGGFDDDGEGYNYGGYEGEGEAMVDPSSMAVAGSSGVDGSKGRLKVFSGLNTSFTVDGLKLSDGATSLFQLAVASTAKETFRKG